MFSFIWVPKLDFSLKAKVLHQHLTLWLPLPSPGDSTWLLQVQSPEAVFWEISNVSVCSLQTLLC